MKQIIKTMVGCLLSILLLQTTCFAAEIDLQGMSVNELIALKDEINLKISELGGSNIIPAGVYVVGRDIRAGRYIFYATVHCRTSYDETEGYMDFELWTSEEAYKEQDRDKRITSGEIYYDFSKDRAEGPFSASLEDGQCLEIRNGSAIIEKISDVSWAP